jgi:hypothetical protein
MACAQKLFSDRKLHPSLSRPVIAGAETVELAATLFVIIVAINGS